VKCIIVCKLYGAVDRLVPGIHAGHHPHQPEMIEELRAHFVGGELVTEAEFEAYLRLWDAEVDRHS
jgi:hypothetical protein